jgi:hypothetical protein
MRSPWSKPVMLETLGDNWDSFPTSAGVYMITSDYAIPRIGGSDEKSIIYIGKTKNLRNRLWGFWKANHTASGVLWTHPTMACIVLNKPIRNIRDVEEQLGKLQVCYSTPIDEHLLDRAERALIFAYIQRFGEAPPLNMSLPRRWEQLPQAQDLRWAEEAVLS